MLPLRSIFSALVVARIQSWDPYNTISGDFSWQILHRAITAARLSSRRIASIHVRRHPRLTAAARNAQAGGAMFLMTLMRAASVAPILCSAAARPCLTACGALPAPDAPGVGVELPACPHSTKTSPHASDRRGAIETTARFAGTRLVISLLMHPQLPSPQSLPFECAEVRTEAAGPRRCEDDQSAPLAPCADEPDLVSGAAPARPGPDRWSRH